MNKKISSTVKFVRGKIACVYALAKETKTFTICSNLKQSYDLKQKVWWAENLLC